MTTPSDPEARAAVGDCPMCGAGGARSHYPAQDDRRSDDTSAYRCTTTTRFRPEVFRCGQCEHWFTDPNSWPASLGGEYESLVDAEYLRMIGVKRRTFKKAADVVCRYARPPAAILEVGSYAGIFLDEMAARGFPITGIEPSTWGAQMAQERGHTVHQGTAEDVLAAQDSEQWDVVVSWDVIEHVPDPRQFVRLLSRAAKPGGLVVFSTLDRGNWFPRLVGRRWPWIIPMHLHYFDQEAIRRISSEAALEFVDTKPHVHYTTPSYALNRLVRMARPLPVRHTESSHLIVPIAFGDVRTFVFRRVPADT